MSTLDPLLTATSVGFGGTIVTYTALQSIMIRRFIKLLYGSTPVEFESATTLEESMRRLSESLLKPADSAPSQEAAKGEVSEAWVSLTHYNPPFFNAFEQRFEGRFVQKEGRVLLAGEFTTRLLVKAFMTFWFGGCLLWIYKAIAAVISSPFSRLRLLFPIWGLFIFGLGVGFVVFARRFSAGDREYLSGVIRRALA